MKTVSQLFFLLQNFLLVGESVSEGDVLKAELIDLFVLLEFGLLLLLNKFRLDFLACAGIYGVLCDTSLEFLELSLNLFTLGLFFIKFSLKLSGHLVVAVLCLFEVETDLMHVGQRVQVLVLIHLLSIGLGMGVAGCLMSLLFVHGGVHEHDLPLQLLVVALQGFLLAEGLLYSDDEFSSQFLLLVQVGDLIDSISVIVIIEVSIVILCSRTLVPSCLSNTVHFRGSLRSIIWVGTLNRSLITDLSAGLLRPRLLGLAGTPSRRVLLAVIVNAGGFSSGSLLAGLFLLLLTGKLLGLSNQFLFLLPLATVSQIPLLFFTVMGVFDDGTGVRDKFHRNADGKLQVGHINTFLRGHAILNLVDLLLTDVDF